MVNMEPGARTIQIQIWANYFIRIRLAALFSLLHTVMPDDDVIQSNAHTTNNICLFVSCIPSCTLRECVCVLCMCMSVRRMHFLLHIIIKSLK